MADRVLSELADAPGGITLVVDDLHELTSPEALAQLTRLLTSLPPRVRAIVATRHDVRLGLHQLRLAGELAEIRAADLRFSERETRELLDAAGIALSEAGVALLYQRTEGWAAGSCRSRRTPSTCTSAASTPSSRSVTGPRPCGAQGSCGCWPLAARASD